MTILRSGSYYLTGDFTASSASEAIYVAASNVTIDLNGFTLDGDDVDTDAIRLHADLSNTTVRNGKIIRWRNIGIIGEETGGIHVENVHIDRVASEGFLFQSGSALVDCSARAR